MKNYIVSSYDHRLVEYYPWLQIINRLKQIYNAEPILLPTAVFSDEQSVDLVPVNILRAFNNNYLTEDLKINKHLIFKPGKSFALRKDPLSGFEALHDRKTVVMGGLPRRLKTLPSPNFTRQIASAGSCGVFSSYSAMTAPQSSGRNYELFKQLARPSISIVTVDEENNKVFHRYVQLDTKEDKAYDLNRVIYANGHVEEYNPVMVLGDCHFIDIDLDAWLATCDQITKIKPSQIIINDGFDGKSVNPHELDNPFANVKSIRYALEDELSVTREYTVSLKALAEKHGGIVKWLQSNHDDFLTRYLAKPEHWSKDSRNNACSAELYAYCLRNLGRHPLEGAFLQVLGVEMLYDYKPTRIEETYVHHGNRGINGAKGVNLQKMSDYLNSSVSAHTHEMAVINNSAVSGTLSNLNPSYRRGVSGWTHGNTLIHPNKAVQQLRIIDGDWAGL